MWRLYENQPLFYLVNKRVLFDVFVYLKHILFSIFFGVATTGRNL